MKKRLLSLFAFVLTVVAVQAQSWTQPSLKLSNSAVPEKAYIYNVEAGKFLTKGGAWGNHACVKSDVSGAFLYEMQLQEDGVSYKLYCAAADKQHMLGRESAFDVYTDYNNQAAWGILWEFVKAASGNYNIRSAKSCPNFGEAAGKLDENEEVNICTYVLGYNPERPDLDKGNGDPMGTFDGVYMVDPNAAEGYSTEWSFMTEADYAVYNAQMSLYNKLNEAIETGYSEADLSSQAALLTSDDVDAVNAAYAEVEKMVLSYAYDHATPENPYDVTAKIVNPTFDGAKGAEPNGWTDEFANMKIQNNKAYPVWDDETGAESSEYGLNNFSQNWTSSATASCGASNIWQTVSDLPQGTYILQADAIATSASASLTVTGAELYATSGAARYACPIDKNPYGEAGAGSPHRYQLMVTHMGGDLTIGYGLSADGYAKWFAVDNFKLYYAGPVDNPGLVALSSAMSAAQPYIDYYAEESKYYYSEASKDKLDGELTSAQSLTDSDECLAAAGTINDLMKTIKAEVAAYGKLSSLIDQVAADIKNYPFLTELTEKSETYVDAYNDKSATAEQINEWVEGYSTYLVDAVKAAMPSATEENPVEVTVLFSNLGFEQNTAESSAPANWTCGAGGFKARANVAEVWNESFDAYITLADLPAGAYRITSHGLSRSGDSVGNYEAEGANVTAEFYANGASVKVKSQHIGAGSEKLYTNDVNLTGDEENPLWAPNSMEGARTYFNVDETPYVNEVTANLIKDGDPLKIGYRDNGANGEVPGNSWTIWSDVRVYYIGVSSNALYQEMLNIASKVGTILEASDVNMVAQSYKNLNEAYQAAEGASSSDSEETIVGIINQLNNAVDYYNAGKTLIAKIEAAIDEYEAILLQYDVDDTKLATLVEEMSDAFGDEEFDSNKQMEDWLAALPAARTAHIFAAVVGDKVASEESPIDVTEVLSNASFESNNANGWTVTNTGGTVGGQEAQRTGSSAYETWNSTAFDIHQTVVGLKEGYYQLSVKALYRNGNNSDDLAAAYFADPDAVKALAQFYANDKSVAVKSIYEDAQTEDPSIDGQATFVYDGQTYYAANTMISFENYAMDKDLYNNVLQIKLDGKTDLTLGLRYETTASYAWFPFDEFKIYYLGTEEPSAVNAVQTVAGKAQFFNLNGQMQNRLQKGVNILRKADGTVVKVLVK